MRFRNFIIFLVCTMVFIFIGLSSPSAAPKDKAKGRVSPDTVLVLFKPHVSEEDKKAVHKRQGGVVLDRIPELGVDIVRVEKGRSKEKADTYKGEPEVEAAEADPIARALFIPNDPLLPEQWHLFRVAAPEAWEITKGSPAIKVAVLDSGIDQSHEDLRGQVKDSKDFTGSGSTDDFLGHGTHVAGIIAAKAQNRKGVAGLAFRCHLLNGKILGDDGSGNYSWMAKGII